MVFNKDKRLDFPYRITGTVFLLVALIFSQTVSSQNHRISFGWNVVHFSDWEHRTLIFFNPEIRYERKLQSDKSIDIGINGFYGEADAADFRNAGDVFQRLIFSFDAGFKKNFGKFAAQVGPSIRYRNEKIRAACISCPPWEFRIQTKKGFIDFGGAAALAYEILKMKNSSFDIKLFYRVYNKPVAPVSVGVFYNR